MAEIKKLRGEELQSMSWEEAKAWCEEQDREIFEQAKANGGYWTTALGLNEISRTYVHTTLDDLQMQICRIRGVCGFLIGMNVVIVLALLVRILQAITTG